MELRDWALHLLTSPYLEDKLFVPELITDQNRGAVVRILSPNRSHSLRFQTYSRQWRLPPLHAHGDKSARILCLHRFAGHELLAVELLAFAILAYPEAPSTYRRSLIHHLKEEQAHVRLYQQRLEAMGCSLDEWPFFRHFWSATPHLMTWQQFVAFMNLTLEQANLDFAPTYLSSFKQHGDTQSAHVMETIWADEINHVKLGVHWWRYGQAAPNLASNDRSDDKLLYEQWVQALPPMITPQRATGRKCFVNARRLAHIPPFWIQQIAPDPKMHLFDQPVTSDQGDKRWTL